MEAGEALTALGADLVVELHERTERLAETVARLATTQAERNTEFDEALGAILTWIEVAAKRIDGLEPAPRRRRVRDWLRKVSAPWPPADL